MSNITMHCEAMTLKHTRCSNGRTSGCTVLDTEKNTRFLCQQHYGKKDEATFRFFDGKGLFVAPITMTKESTMTEIPASFVFAFKAEEKCQRCSGTGTYVWGTILNGVPSHGGVCYRCNGNGLNWVANIDQVRKLITLVDRMTEEEWDYICSQLFLRGGFDFARTMIEYFSQPANPVIKKEVKTVTKTFKHVGGELTTNGVVCGKCTKEHGKQVKHANVAAVKACYQK